MSDDTAQRNLAFSQKLIAALVAHNVTRFLVCPGARSTPLVLALAACDTIDDLVHLDERGAAFAALGYGRATGIPAAVITTSGTAVANLLPAVVESSQDLVPMILLTADRPSEIRLSGGNQTINQDEIFGSYPRVFWEPSEGTCAKLDDSGWEPVMRAIGAAVSPMPGPVHINCPFDEPLVDPTQDLPVTKPGKTEHHPADSIPGIGAANLDDSDLVVVGHQHCWRQLPAVSTTRPVLADITSQLRLGRQPFDRIDHYDLLLAANASLGLDMAITVLHVGGRFVSKCLLHFLQDRQVSGYALVTNHDSNFDPVGRRNEPKSRQATGESPSGDTVGTLTKDSSWVGQVLDEMLDATTDLSEQATARMISRHIDAEAALFLGSSMPVRLMDSYAVGDGPAVPVGCNRGASGIDGTLASAVGFADGLQKPVTLFLGDTAFLHDLNSLLMLKASRFPIIIVMINNDGGGIFRHLPVANVPEVFERYFVAPHGCSFQKIADALGVASYFHPSIQSEFIADYQQAQSSGQSSLIEVTTDRDRTFDWQRQVVQEISKRLGRR